MQPELPPEVDPAAPGRHPALSSQCQASWGSRARSRERVAIWSPHLVGCGVSPDTGHTPPFSSLVCCHLDTGPPVPPWDLLGTGTHVPGT